MYSDGNVYLCKDEKNVWGKGKNSVKTVEYTYTAVSKDRVWGKYNWNEVKEAAEVQIM